MSAVFKAISPTPGPTPRIVALWWTGLNPILWYNYKLRMMIMESSLKKQEIVNKIASFNLSPILPMFFGHFLAVLIGLYTWKYELTHKKTMTKTNTRTASKRRVNIETMSVCPWKRSISPTYKYISTWHPVELAASLIDFAVRISLPLLYLHLSSSANILSGRNGKIYNFLQFFFHCWNYGCLRRGYFTEIMPS